MYIQSTISRNRHWCWARGFTKHNFSVISIWFGIIPFVRSQLKQWTNCVITRQTIMNPFFNERKLILPNQIVKVESHFHEGQFCYQRTFLGFGPSFWISSNHPSIYIKSWNLRYIKTINYAFFNWLMRCQYMWRGVMPKFFYNHVYVL